MNKVNLLQQLENYLSTLNTKSFTDFTERLLQKLYPQEDIVLEGTIKKNNHCIIAGSLYKPQFLPVASNINSNSIINTDLVNFKNEIKKSSKLIYLTNNSNFSFSEEYKADLIKKYPNLSVEIWSPKSIQLKLLQLNEQDFDFVLAEFMMYEDYQETYSTPENDRNILEDIFNYLFTVKLKKEDIPPPNRDKFTEFTDKVKINFEISQRERITQTYKNNYHRIAQIKYFVENQLTQDESPVNELIDMIQDKFCLLAKVPNSNYPIKDHLFIQEIGKTLLEDNKINNPHYLSCAKSIVIYFFELCDIGKKTEAEVSKSANSQDDPFLFDEMN